ncbi:hypothetical protein M5X04_27120 [Paenibacillus alvei]|uniref:Phage protein n=1 Tax=Paenibacillus alvei TaxID=44250 RepID=A0ABT4EKV1_PAEAL|nr:hypothetical protein [Paenibacillus alvei]MCY9532986.1 hypothetical protein [Paenibacillus alvei]
MQIGIRIIYDAQTGRVLNGVLGEMSGDIQDGLRPGKIDFIDLPFGYNDNNFKKAASYHINATKSKAAPIVERIVIDRYIQQPPTEAERIKELEDQLLVQENERVGGIL